MIRTPTTSLRCFCRNQRGYRKATIKAGWIFDNLQVFKLLGILFDHLSQMISCSSPVMSGPPPCQNRNTGCRRSGTSDFHGIHGKQGERMDFVENASLLAARHTRWKPPIGYPRNSQRSKCYNFLPSFNFSQGSFVQQVSKKVPQQEGTPATTTDFSDIMWLDVISTTTANFRDLVTFPAFLINPYTATDMKTSAVAKRTGGCKW